MTVARVRRSLPTGLASVSAGGRLGGPWIRYLHLATVLPRLALRDRRHGDRRAGHARPRAARAAGRGSEMKLSRGVARFNRRVTNRIQGVYAWLLPPWAVILHRGRRSGREYRTPLFAFRRGRTLVIALLYGGESDWLRNLRAGGHVIRAGRTFTVGPPDVIDTSAAGLVLARPSRPERAYCRLAEQLAILELEERLPGFGAAPRQRVRVTRSSSRSRERQVRGRHTCRCSNGQT